MALPFLDRHIRPHVVEALNDTRVVVLLGARQVGKSTLAREISIHEHPADTLTLDDRATRIGALYHYRDRDGREVDAILERHDGAIVGVEAKAAASVGASDFRGLTRVRDALGERFKAGAVLYTGPNTVRFGDRLTAIPLQGLWATTP